LAKNILKGFCRVTTLPGKSWNLGRPFARPGKSWKTARVMESHGNYDDVLEFFCKKCTLFIVCPSLFPVFQFIV